ncbi:MAG TPA: RHS repeat-associated core domain-containing protein, partial [Pyrinomonadaceae bacterium]|nr:RHS repeat-associated core domain-containing protein [Pyrinomonadaceae bacterium]
SATNRISNDGWYYDAAGNQTRVQNGASWQRYQYDAANRLVKVKADDNTTVLLSYTFGSSNQRLIREEGSARTYYVAAGDSEMCEYTETGGGTSPSWAKSYVYLGGRLLSTLTPNGSGGEAVTYHHPERIGTRLVSNAQNTSSFEQATLPFGGALDTETTGTPTNRRFTSYDRVSGVGLDYAVNRHYDWQQGRFTQVDPIGMRAASLSDPQSLNMYSYVGNDPVNRVDPSGLFWGKLWRAIKKILRSKWFQIALAVAFIVIAHYYPHSLFGWLGGGSTHASGAVAPTLHTATATAAQKAASAAFWEAAFARGGVAALEGVVATSGAASAVQLGVLGAQLAGVITGQAPLEGGRGDVQRMAKEEAKKMVKLDSCKKFLLEHGINPKALLGAINKQRAFDGLKSTLTALKAGLVPRGDAMASWTVKKVFEIKDPIAATGSHRLATRYDVYYGNGMGNPVTTVIHEALHSLTRLNDFDLAVKIGAVDIHNVQQMTRILTGDTSIISEHLALNGCYKL